MIPRRSSRFADLVQRQLDLFAVDEADVIAEAEEAERAYGAAAVEDAEEAYGDYQLVLEAGSERLAELRDAYAARLDGDAVDEYADAFRRAARRRFPGFLGEL